MTDEKYYDNDGKVHSREFETPHNRVNRPQHLVPATDEAGSLKVLGIVVAVLIGFWGTVAQAFTIIGLAWVIPAFVMAGRTNRPWYNVMNWVWGLGPFALIILGRERKRYPTFGAMVSDNVGASIAIGIAAAFTFYVLIVLTGSFAESL